MCHVFTKSIITLTLLEVTTQCGCQNWFLMVSYIPCCGVFKANHNRVCTVTYTFPSLRRRRLKGKGKGVSGARETRGEREEGGKEVPFLLARPVPRVSLAPKTPFPFPSKRLPRRLYFPQITHTADSPPAW